MIWIAQSIQNVLRYYIINETWETKKATCFGQFLAISLMAQAKLFLIWKICEKVGLNDIESDLQRV